MPLSMQSTQINVTHTLVYHKIKSDFQKSIYAVSLTNCNTLIETDSLFNASEKSLN